MDKQEAQLLLEECKNGNKAKAIDKIYRETSNFVYRYIFSRIGNQTWAEDILSDTYFTLLDIVDRYDGSSKIETFIIGIANNKIIQYLSKLPQNTEELDEELIVPETHYSEEKETAKIDLKLLNGILDKLPGNYRKTLENRFLKTMSIKETAAHMKISEANVRVIQHRALKEAAEIANNLEVKLNIN